MRFRGQRGMTLIEVLVSLAVVGVIIGMSATMVSTALRGTQDNVNKQYATQKAVSMLEELRALIQTQSGATSVVLDAFDDGTTNQVILTTQRGITDPAHPASGNRRAAGGWLYERRISVQRLRGINDLRLVNVQVYVRDPGGVRLLAEVAGVLSTIGQSMPPSQVYDVYLVAIENVPGWWLYMQNVVPFVENAMQDLEARHPGLLFRRHWIRKLSYGRDSYYTPYVNEAEDSTEDIPNVYFYPGLLPSGSAVESYYPPDFFSGRVSVDGTVRNGYDATANPLPYSLADQYNNGMRYPDELALFNARVSAGLESADSPTLRLLLDDMYLHPANYRNAIVINLHGELFPFPPVRNYSDPAKAPTTNPWVRAVTHPERLHSGPSDAVRLRVYGYHTNVTSPGTVPDWLGRGGSATPISVVLKGISWTPTSLDIASITGGVDFDGNGHPDEYVREAGSTTSAGTAAPTHMWWSSSTDGTDTVIRLYNTPLKTPCAEDEDPCDLGGLDSGSRLYSLEYIPSPVDNLATSSATAFQEDLTDDGTGPKNTARWIIQVPSSVLPASGVLTFETRIGDDLTTGTVYPTPNVPENVSRTYVWRGSDVWLYGDASNDPNLPMTERFQFLGDPRHCPYADLKMAHFGSGRTQTDRLGMGYNRYFDDFHASGSGNNRLSSWPGWSYEAPAFSGTWFGVKNNSSDTTNNNDGWNTGTGMLEIDIPRIFQTLRSALLRTNAVYTTLTGFSYFYVGIGGEIGYDSSNGFANSIPVSSLPFTGSSGSRNEQSITDAETGGVKYIRENTSGNYWWGMSWLGELAPDSAWSTWTSTGNLLAGSGSGRFVRTLRGSISTRLPAGTALNNAVRRTAEEGSTAFFWNGSANSTFHHRYQDSTTATLTTDGQAIATNYRLPLASDIPNSRPFAPNVNDTSMNPDHFLQAAYGSATSLTTLEEFYRHSTNISGSALLAMRSGSDASFLVVNGLSPSGESGVSFIARWSFLSLIQSYLAAGLYSTSGSPDPARVRELPRVEITSPNDDTDIVDPTSIPIVWTSTWRRWDGIPYTPDYSSTFSESLTVRFALLYSRDNGRTWLHMQDDSAATPGVRPATSLMQTGTTYSWSVPRATFPRGNYLIRIEAYREGLPLHYSFHQYRAYIKR